MHNQTYAPLPGVAARDGSARAARSGKHETTRPSEGVHRKNLERSGDLPALMDSTARGAGTDGREP
jgi:hypothetical protein